MTEYIDIMHQIFDVGNFIVAIKVYVHYFYVFHENKAFNKLAKLILFYQKRCFSSQDF